MKFKCKISNTFIGEIETGKKYPSPKTFEKIASVLTVEPYVLLLPKCIVLKEIDRNELLHKITKELKNVINEDLDTILKKYLVKE